MVSSCTLPSRKRCTHPGGSLSSWSRRAAMVTDSKAARSAVRGKGIFSRRIPTSSVNRLGHHWRRSPRAPTRKRRWIILTATGIRGLTLACPRQTTAMLRGRALSAPRLIPPAPDTAVGCTPRSCVLGAVRSRWCLAGFLRYALACRSQFRSRAILSEIAACGGVRATGSGRGVLPTYPGTPSGEVMRSHNLYRVLFWKDACPAGPTQLLRCSFSLSTPGRIEACSSCQPRNLQHCFTVVGHSDVLEGSPTCG